MRLRKHERETSQQSHPSAPTDDSSGEDLAEMRSAGEDLLRAADAAVDKALSGDSRQYNRESQQTGGQ